ncbi:MAG: DoxX family protein, partial [Lysobacterales bacterium]
SLGELWESYLITAKGAGNFKLPLLYLVMLLPLVFYGGGKMSCDHLLLKMTGRQAGVDDRLGDAVAFSLALLVLGLTTVFLEPFWGLTFLALALLALITPALRR